MNDDDKAYDSQWHLDRKVPIAMIMAIAAHFAGFVWMAAKFDARIEAVERQMITSAPHSDRITRMEVKVENIERGVTRIENVLQGRALTAPSPANR